MIELIIVLICFLSFGIFSYSVSYNNHKEQRAEFKEKELEMVETYEDLDSSFIEDNCDIALQTSKLNNSETLEK